MCVVTISSAMSSCRCRGFGFVSYGDHESAMRAVDEMNGMAVNGRTLYCGRAQKRKERQAELQRRFEAEKMERYSKYQGVNLYVKNLEDEVEDERLRKEFSKFGNITSAKVRRGEGGGGGGTDRQTNGGGEREEFCVFSTTVHKPLSSSFPSRR